MTQSRQVVFLCVANSARSQMAEGLARASAPVGWRVYSAGTEPGTVNPLATRVLAEIGIDIGSHRSKGLGEVPVDSADIVVTLCAEEACPTTAPHAKRLSWPMPDPATQGRTEVERLKAFRSARDAIQRSVSDLWVKIENGEI